MGSIAGVSPRFTARMAGLFYLLYAVIAGLAGFARRGILIGGDAAATATNIIAHQSLSQLGLHASASWNASSWLLGEPFSSLP